MFVLKYPIKSVWKQQLEQILNHTTIKNPITTFLRLLIPILIKGIDFTANRAWTNYITIQPKH